MSQIRTQQAAEAMLNARASIAADGDDTPSAAKVAALVEAQAEHLHRAAETGDVPSHILDDHDDAVTVGRWLEWSRAAQKCKVPFTHQMTVEDAHARGW